MPQARVTTETHRLDLGLADVRFRLVSGWSADERAADGTSFVWAVGSSSTLNLFITEPRPLELSFRCWPFHYRGAPMQQLEMSFNGNDFGRIDLDPPPAEYRISIPAMFQVPGENTLEVRYRYHRRPRDVVSGATDERSLAVGWDWLRLEGAVDPQPPQIEDPSGLRIPFHTRLDYILPVSPHSTLVIDEVDVWDPALPADKPYLMVSIQTITEGVDTRVDEVAASRRIEVALPATDEGELVRISLAAGSGMDLSPDEGGLRLVRPRVQFPLAPRPAASKPPPARRPNIIVYLVDTLRADHLSCYGYGKPTPRIDDFARDGTLFEKAYAQSSWTRPSVASFLTGLRPRAHGVNRREDALSESVSTLAEQLARLGYDTGGLVTNSNVAPVFGFGQGFETYELLTEETPQLGYVRADRLVARAIRWLEERPPDDPFFLYLHANDPHDPYLSPEPGAPELQPGTMPFMKALEAGDVESSPELLETLVGLYDEEVAFTDVQFGVFLDFLQAAGLYESTLIIFLSDHGEEFHDHGWWRHGKTLYGEQLNVPWIVKWPERFAAGRRVSSVAQHIDLLPTVLDYLGESPPSGLQGRSLWPIVQTPQPGGTPPAVLSYLSLDGRELESIIYRGRKLIRTFIYDRDVPPFQLFDLDADPTEGSSLSAERPITVDFLRALLRRPSPEPSLHAVPVEIDESLERSLRALGYIR